MNTEWADKNKEMQSLLKKNTFSEGIESLIELRNMLFEEILSWRNILTDDEFCKIPFINSNGYHSKTVAYSIWHIIRIEDIVVNSLILNREEILFSGDFVRKTNSPVITTGNEFVKQEIADFSKTLDINALYEYSASVKKATDEWLGSITYADLKTKFTDEDRENLKALGVVSDSEEASWLIDYWCGKDIKGLIQMPLSRHWIMHIEASKRIIDKIKK